MIRRPTASLAAAAVLTLALSGCVAPSASSHSGGSGGPRVVDNGTDDSCFSEFEPVDTGVLTGPSVKGTVKVFCKIPPREHHLEIRLQREVNGAWTDQSKRQWDDIPPTIPFFRFTTASCVPGSWRVMYSVWGTSASGMVFDKRDRTGMTKKVNPSDCG